MGTCLSKKSVCATCSPIALPKPLPATVPEKCKPEAQMEKRGEEPKSVVKKEIFIIKHRNSHEIERQRSDEERGESANKGGDESAENGCEIESFDGNGCSAVVVGATVRTSSCTKEEVDAILIQCGRLSRSSSAAKAAENGGRKYSGSKRSYDFDNDTGNNGDDERENRRRERQRQSPGRRRTPSREKERELHLQPRSGSRERTSGRRVSRSPGRRSESPITTRVSNSNSNSSSNSRPGKMVSVPAVSLDKQTEPNSNPNSTSIKRIQVKRNAGSAAASPRARSPARNQQQPLSLSRSNSRKAENSPFRRNPLALNEIDTNIMPQPQVSVQKPNVEEPKGGSFVVGESVGVNVIPSGQDKESQWISQTVTRSRSSRLSRDLDAINPDTLTNPNAPSSYTALLLEDIHNFHQKNSNPSVLNLPVVVTVPPCVTKAHSILEAVANLNLTTGEHMSKITADNKVTKHSLVLESVAVGDYDDDLMEPSFHKYVTVKRGAGADDFEEQQESSGSNSFVGGQQVQQHWVSASCWETNSAESTDPWTCSASSSSSKARAVGKQKAASESGEVGKKVITKKRDSDHQSSNGRLGRRGPHLPALAAST